MLLDLQLIAMGWLALFLVFVIALKFFEPRSAAWRVRPSSHNASKNYYCDAATVARNLNTMRARRRAVAPDQGSRNALNPADLVNPR